MPLPCWLARAHDWPASHDQPHAIWWKISFSQRLVSSCAVRTITLGACWQLIARIEMPGKGAFHTIVLWRMACSL